MFDKLLPYISTYSWHDRRIITSILSTFHGTVLDVGCGNKRLQTFLPNDSQYTGIDFNPGADQQLDISSSVYPFPDKSFDYVICNAVLEHVADEHFVLKEIYRVLKPGGVLYVSIPFLQPYHADPEDYRRYTTVGLGQVLEQHGFTLIKNYEAYGTLLTIEYLIIAEVGHFLRYKPNIWNPLRWLYLMSLVGLYGLSKIGNLIFYSIERHDTQASPGTKYLCRKPA